MTRTNPAPSDPGSFRVNCKEGFDGGLPQSFLLEVYDGEDLKSKVTNQQPEFEISHLDSDGMLKIYVFAQNAKGSSEPYILEEEILKHIKKHSVEGEFVVKSNRDVISNLKANFLDFFII